MALLPGGPQVGTKYKLTGPDGTIATFNDSSDANFVGYLTEITGLDSPEVRESAENIAGLDGGIHGDFYYGRRPITLSGQIINAISNKDRNEKVTKMVQAANAMRKDAILEWTPEGGEASFVAVRRAQPVRVTGGFNKEFQLSLVSADPRIYSAALNHLEGEVGALAKATSIEETPAGVTGAPVHLNAVYITSKAKNFIAVYTRNLETGVLTKVETKATGTGPTACLCATYITSLSLKKDDKLYVVNTTANTVSKFTRNTETAALTVLGSAIATGEEPVSITQALNGKFVIVANKKGKSLTVYTRNGTTGDLTFKETVTTHVEEPIVVAMAPYSSSLLYVLDAKKVTLTVFTATTEGKLTFRESLACATSPIAMAAYSGSQTAAPIVVVTGKSGSTGLVDLFAESAENELGEPILFKEEQFTVGGTSSKPNGIAFIDGGKLFPPKNNVIITDEGELLFREYEIQVTGSHLGLIGTNTAETVPVAPYALEKSLYIVELGGYELREYAETTGKLTTKIAGLPCTNQGSGASYPVLVMEVYPGGSITEPTFINTTTGASFTITGTYTGPETVTIDFLNRTISNPAGHIFSKVSFASSQWWALEPGADEVRISPAAITPTVFLKVTWRNAWI